jgi:imidazole glycerol-phosphate synthase subunit HisH
VIALIDYGAGNLTSVRRALAAVGAEVMVPRTPADLEDAAAVVVPGVGHFGATHVLRGAWTDAILGRLGEGRPVLGICLGMQWLFEGSEEAPDLPGLGVLAGMCVRLQTTTGTSKDTSDRASRDGHAAAHQPHGRIKIPHVGWNTLDMRAPASIVEGLPPDAQVYFTHSYAAPITGDVVAVTTHGVPFAAVVQRGQVAGVQFHPEKSGDIGLRVLRNFVQLAA